MMEWQIDFYSDKDTNEPVKDFILGESPGSIAEIIHVFKLLRNFNVMLGMPYVRKIGKSGIRELRIKHGSEIYRIYFFAYTGKKFILLHAIKKKQNKTLESDTRIAIQRMNDYISRCFIKTDG